MEVRKMKSPKVVSKKFSEVQLHVSAKNYSKFLKRYCSKKEILELFVELLEDYFPDDLCEMYLGRD